MMRRRLTLLLAAAWTALNLASACAQTSASAAAPATALAADLLDAAYRGDIEGLRKVLDAGGNVNAHHASTTALIVAAEQGHKPIVNLLVERGAKIDAKDGSGENALLCASVNGHEGIVRLLLKHGASVTVEDADGSTPLQSAVVAGHLDIARALIDAGSDVRHRPPGGSSILNSAVATDDRAFLKLLVQHGAELMPKANADHPSSSPENIFSTAASDGDVEALKYFVEATKPNPRRSEMLNQALHSACESGKIEAVRFLLGLPSITIDKKDDDAPGGTSRVDPSDKSDGYTPLSRAVSGGHDAIARLLLEKGARLRGRTNSGEPLLMFAIKRNRAELVAMLLAHKPAIDEVDFDGRTALMAAAETGNLPMVKLLLEKKANANHQDVANLTALHLAAASGHTDVIEALLAAGASASVKDAMERTPAFYAEQEGYVAAADLLAKAMKAP